MGTGSAPATLAPPPLITPPPAGSMRAAAPAILTASLRPEPVASLVDLEEANRGLAHLDLYPDSRTRRRTGAVQRCGEWWIPIYCANCSKPQGLVPESGIDFVVWLCDPCADTWGNTEGTYLVPDEIFRQKVLQAQLEKAGRTMTVGEIMQELDDPHSPLSVLARSRAAEIRMSA